MCGLVGILNTNGEAASPAVLRRMMASIAHRGPDGEGFYENGAIGLGHRRLAVLDTTPLGAQPMLSADGDVAIVYNGTLYNFRELRALLQGRGHIFHSVGDTEVLLHAWMEWGEGALERFNGHFAFAIWDKRIRTLYVARDRYGVKPLYWTVAGSAFLFASEHKALLEHPDVQRNVDCNAILEYFTFQNFFSTRTLLEKVELFPAGCLAKIRENGAAKPEIKRYWDYSFRDTSKANTDPREYTEKLDALLRQAIRRQMVSDVELGAFLSGGLDSGTISAVAAHDLPELKSFTCGFDLSDASGQELSFDERVRAEAMSARFGTEHYEMVLKNGDMERIMSKLAWHIEEPRVGQSYPNYYASKLASRFVKVVLSGAGGDELFGGYPWRYYRACHHKDFNAYVDDYYRFWQRLLPNRLMPDLLRPIWDRVKNTRTRDIFASVFNGSDTTIDRPEDAINLSLYFEAKTFLHGLLIVDDKLAMANGLEMRLPFLDNDLVDFAMSCPVCFKLRNLHESVKINENISGPKKVEYFKRTHDGKLILREVAKQYIPDDIAGAVKQGFSAPDATWFRSGSVDFVKTRLFNRRQAMYEFLNYDTVETLVNEHIAGVENRRLLIWSLLYFGYWLENYLL